jgi:hypothetical protein
MKLLVPCGATRRHARESHDSEAPAQGQYASPHRGLAFGLMAHEAGGIEAI